MSNLTSTDDKFVTLLFLNSDHKYEIEQYINGTWSESWYLPVFRVPRVEMLTSEPQALATELIGITASPEWLERRNRQMIRGDMFHRGNEVWVYIRTEDSEKLAKMGMTVYPLPAIDNGRTSIARIA